VSRKRGVEEMNFRATLVSELGVRISLKILKKRIKPFWIFEIEFCEGICFYLPR